VKDLSLYLSESHFNMQFGLSGGMAVYCSNMIRQYRLNQGVHLIGPKPNYSSFEHPINSIGVHHNLNGFELGLSEDLLPQKTKQVITVHDSQELVFPQNFSREQLSQRSKVHEWIRQNEPKVICISEFTRKELINRAHLPESIMHVVPHGFDHLHEWQEYTSEDFWYANQDFIYVPGKAWKHKGHLNLLPEIARILPFFRDNNLKVYFACHPRDLGIDLQNWISKHKANDVLYLIPDMSNEQHLSLMKNAALILLPSQYEGFGFSYGESIYLNKVVVAFELPPYLEVSDRGHFVELDDYRSLMEVTIRAYESRNVQTLDEKILDLTWAANVQKIIDLVRA
jgi:glycosyltransferase involved in cell wall biosynthesis